MRKIDQPLTIFLIGTTGDLAKKKILKALYKLFQEDLLPETFYLVGNARTEFSQTEYIKFLEKVIKPSSHHEWRIFSKQVRYVAGDVSEAATFAAFHDLEKDVLECGNRLWYVATLPELYQDIVKNIHSNKLAHTECGWTKLLLEKPFGTDLESSRQLNAELKDVFAEEQIYRIDHFLAKETVQNILVFRFANGIFEHLWNNTYIDHIQITAAETLGIEGRERFYDSTGTVRDVIQNHVLQMLAVALMEEPSSLDPTDIRNARQKLLSQLRLFTEKSIHENAAFGQFSAGSLSKIGYTEHEKIPDDSTTETAVALKCFVDNARWKDTPIYIRAGKQLAEDYTQISIHFKEPSNQMFRSADCKQQANVLVLRIQPKEGVHVTFLAKKPGLTLELEEVPMQFAYHNTFEMGLVEAYVKLIYDAVQGDATLFPRADGIESSWQYVQPLLDHLASSDFKPEAYPSGSWGPASFTELLERDGRTWLSKQL